MAISSDLKQPWAVKAAKTPCSCGHGWDGVCTKAIPLLGGMHAPSDPTTQPRSRAAIAGLHSATVCAGRRLGGWGTFILRGHSEIGSQSLLPGKILDKDAHGSIT